MVSCAPLSPLMRPALTVSAVVDVSVPAPCAIRSPLALNAAPGPAPVARVRGEARERVRAGAEHEIAGRDRERAGAGVSARRRGGRAAVGEHHAIGLQQRLIARGAMTDERRRIQGQLADVDAQVPVQVDAAAAEQVQRVDAERGQRLHRQCKPGEIVAGGAEADAVGAERERAFDLQAARQARVRAGVQQQGAGGGEHGALGHVEHTARAALVVAHEAHIAAGRDQQRAVAARVQHRRLRSRRPRWRGCSHRLPR